MSLSKNLFKQKKSGAYRRQLKLEVQAVLGLTNLSETRQVGNVVDTHSLNNTNLLDNSFDLNDSSVVPTIVLSPSINSDVNSDADIESVDLNYDDQLEEDERNNKYIAEEFRFKLKDWAIEYKPTQSQLKALLAIINSTLPYKVPSDPRTLLHTPKHVNIVSLGPNEQYWHHGIKKYHIALSSNSKKDK